MESVNAACRSLLYMCGFVVLFAALLSLSDASGLAGFFQHVITRPLIWAGADTAEIPNLLAGILEVSCGCVEAAGSGAAAPFCWALLWVGAACPFIASWPPPCTSTSCSIGTSSSPGCFTACWPGGLSLLLFRFVPLPLDVFNPMQDARITPFTTSAAASVALLLMCAMLLLTGKGPARLGRKG